MPHFGGLPKKNQHRIVDVLDRNSGVVGRRRGWEFLKSELRMTNEKWFLNHIL
jgi:hypothetical protein